MKPTHSQQSDFLSHRPLPGVTFRHNDPVRVMGGEHKGETGSIVSIEALGPDPLYLVELESNKDALIPQSLLLATGA